VAARRAADFSRDWVWKRAKSPETFGCRLVEMHIYGIDESA
jgi:hypothetical protein